MPKAGQKTQFYAANQVAGRNKVSMPLFHDETPQPNVGAEHERLMNGGFKMRTGKMA